MEDNTKIAIIGGIVAVLAFSLVAQPFIKEEKRKGVQELDNTSSNVPELGYVEAAVCSYPFYEIEYVDSINSNRCYAIRNVTKGYEVSMLRDSIKNNESMSEYFDRNYAQGKKIICQRTDNPGKAWCLRDNSTCLLLEENDKICNIVNLGG